MQCSAERHVGVLGTVVGSVVVVHHTGISATTGGVVVVAARPGGVVIVGLGVAEAHVLELIGQVILVMQTWE